jgi:hypothetical protein
MEGPLSSDLGHAQAVKVQGIGSWIHLSRVKNATEESTSNQAKPGDTYSLEPIEDLKLIFQRSQKTSS